MFHPSKVPVTCWVFDNEQWSCGPHTYLSLSVYSLWYTNDSTKGAQNDHCNKSVFILLWNNGQLDELDTCVIISCHYKTINSYIIRTSSSWAFPSNLCPLPLPPFTEMFGWHCNTVQSKFNRKWKWKCWMTQGVEREGGERQKEKRRQRKPLWPGSQQTHRGESLHTFISLF